MQRRLALILGIVLSFIAIFMVKLYTDQQRKVYQREAAQRLAQERANQAAVLVAKEDIPRGIIIEPDMLETAIVPKEYVQPKAVNSLDRIGDMVTAAPISKGEQITLSKLVASQQQATGGSLAMATPVGKRAITISVDNIAALGWMIRPGDYVDVIGMIPTAMSSGGKEITQVSMMPLFQNVLVLAVGQDLGVATVQSRRYQKEEKKEVAPIITLALNPQEANLIAFVQEQGKIRLVLRSPSDSQLQTVPPANWETLLMYLTPQEALEKAISAKEKEKAPTKTVEIYRGLQKEIIPLSR